MLYGQKAGHLNLGLAYQRGGDFVKSVQSFETALQVSNFTAFGDIWTINFFHILILYYILDVIRVCISPILFLFLFALICL